MKEVMVVVVVVREEGGREEAVLERDAELVIGEGDVTLVVGKD
jgi:hypothetical protein